LYEAEVNIVAHAEKGEMLVDIDTSRIKVTLIDEGPGIEDIEKAMTAGFSTASERVRQMGFGAGMGLPNIKKNVDDFNLSSKVGEGTELEISINIVA
jgi:anti-sigma regulatory factor (Ser/Thr protein kinase)